MSKLDNVSIIGILKNLPLAITIPISCVAVEVSICRIYSKLKLCKLLLWFCL